MSNSSLLGTHKAPQVAPGTDTAALGPGDNSDSGSDVAGIEEGDGADIGVPTDVAMRDDMPHPLMPKGAMGGAASDAAGTGERRSAASDAGLREAADIGVDRVFTPGRPGSSGAAGADVELDYERAQDDAASQSPAKSPAKSRRGARR
jgi:hypothetical protein